MYLNRFVIQMQIAQKHSRRGAKAYAMNLASLDEVAMGMYSSLNVVACTRLPWM